MPYNMGRRECEDVYDFASRMNAAVSITTGRKQSLRGDHGLVDCCFDDTFDETAETKWFNKIWVRRCMRLLALLSLLSVCLNTPKTFKAFPFLKYATFFCDSAVTLILTAEMISKIKIRKSSAYWNNHWCQFDAAMVLFHWISVVLHMFQVYVTTSPAYLSVLRAPRPFILIRFIRVFLRFSMPKSRINQIFVRSSQQIYNVTLFFLFFMTLFGLLGVQMFGQLQNHCILNTTDPKDVTLNSLAIPDAQCSREPGAGYQCPTGMKCAKLDHLSRYVTGFSGFDEFATSIFTVYQAAGQEGWVYIMFRTWDSLAVWRSVFYFSTLIFFLAWLVKNVFIAVITETFNEIRVQFQQMWAIRQAASTNAVTQVLEEDDRGLRLVPVNESKHVGWAPQRCRAALNSPIFNKLLMAAIVANAAVTSTMSFKHDGRPRQVFYRNYYYFEVFFTALFDAEAAFKIWCLGWFGYLHHSLHKFELMLCFFTTLHIIPSMYLSSLAYFQVLRIGRLIKASRSLEDFVYKVFGPGKKLGSLIAFTICLLLISSGISMQLFCYLNDFPKFETFPEAFMSMFQILTQEAWVDVMDETMQRSRPAFVPLVATYFIFYHVFVTLIVLSLFVAVILDNLELDEDLKKSKQLKFREQNAEIKETLPLRLRIFQKFPDRPRMATIPKQPSDFNLPKVRESFMRQFMYDVDEDECMQVTKRYNADGGARSRRVIKSTRLLNEPTVIRRMTDARRKEAIAHIISESNKQRISLDDNTVAQGKAGGLNHANYTVNSFKHGRNERRKSLRRSIRGGSVKLKQTYEHFIENGDVGTATGRMPVTSKTMATTFANVAKSTDIDIKLLEAKRQQAEMRRNQREEDLRENHPLFDTPLFVVARESNFRRFCQRIVYARYDPMPPPHRTRKLTNKQLRNFLGLVTYVDWAMICVTTLSCISMMFETADYRVTETASLRVAEYMFVACMSVELALKILADGLLFTPNAYLKDVAAAVDLFIYLTSLVFLWWMPHEVSPKSAAHCLMLLRCLRPLRIFTLVPHMRKVVDELCRGFKEIFLVAVLLVLLMFIFGIYGVEIFGGRLARCNDPSITVRRECTGTFLRRVFVTKMRIAPGPNETHPQILVPRVWANPRRFNFDNLGSAMLILFEVLSFKGWLEVRDIIMKAVGPVIIL